MLDDLGRNGSGLSQILDAARDKNVSIFLVPNSGDCTVVIADAKLQLHTIIQAENKLAYLAYKGFLKFGRGAIFISPLNLLKVPENILKIEAVGVYLNYLSKQEIINYWKAFPAQFHLLTHLLINKVERYEPETEAVIVFFFISEVVLIQFKEFQLKPRDCYKKLAFLEASLN